MAQKSQNTSSAQGANFDKNLVEDVDGMHKDPNQWSQARNAVTNTVRGDLYELSNESSNYLCATAPYTIIGRIHLQADEWAIFSTDDTNSEVGIFKEDACEYKTIVNDSKEPCLGLNKDHLIKGVGRTTFDCGRQVYWDDGVNPTRLLNLDDVPWVQECETVNSCQICVDTDKVDCDKLRLAPLVEDLSFRVERGNASGQIINGSYYVVGAYLVNGVKVTDYSLPSNVQPLFTHENIASSLDIFIEEADQTFDEFELILVQFANFNTVAKKLGVYSTRQKKITLDQINESLPAVDPGELLIQNPIPDKSDAVYRNGPYMIRTGPSNKFDFNYQPLANQITSKWVSVEYDDEYYRNGGSNAGYMRDEVYSFFIRWVYNTGDKSKSYHIPGRVSRGNEFSFISGEDVLASDDPVRWKVYNTATVDASFPSTGDTLPDGGVILGGGDMAYWQSSEIYDDDKPQVWNASAQTDWGAAFLATVKVEHDLCGKNIRHHKFPDNGKDPVITNHYDPTDGSKIRIMGVQFDNIKPPLNNDGTPIGNVVGYEILRGSREGNKTVLAKGMVNNMRAYVTEDNINNPDAKVHLYPNYPYNPVAKAPDNWDIAQGKNGNPTNVVVDHFLSSSPTEYKGGSLFNFLKGGKTTNGNNAFLQGRNKVGLDAPLGFDFLHFQNGSNIREDLLTFHSPETNFRNPFLSAKEIKVYGELQGSMVGKFEFPKEHPRHKFITDTSFFVSALIGLGYGLISTEGTKSVEYHSPSVDYGGTYTQIGVSTGTHGLVGPSAIPASVQSGSVIGAMAAITGINAGLDFSLGSTIGNFFGVNVNSIRDGALNAAGQVSGSIGGRGSTEVHHRTKTAWEATPGFLRVIQGVPAFLTYWGEGTNKMLDIIYAFSPYRQYALQQISHCFYNKFEKSSMGNIRRSLDKQNYLKPELQNFTQDYVINNIFRSRTVALKLNADLNLPKGALDPDTGERLPDNTQALYSDVWGRTSDRKWQDDYVNTEFERPAASHYVAMKQRLDNQYGQIGSIIQVPVSTDVTSTVNSKSVNATKSKVLFNGDTYIGRYTEKNTMFFFYDWLKGQPDGAEFDYKLRNMVTYPRFWMDTDPFDMGEFMQSLTSIFDGADSPPESFNPFMRSTALITDPGDPDYDPAVEITDPSDPKYEDKYNCNCYTRTQSFSPHPCFFIQDVACEDELAEHCDLQEQVYQLELYIDFLDDCACFRDTATGGCNDEGDEQDPGTDPIYTDPHVFPGSIGPDGEPGPSGGCDGVYHPYDDKGAKNSNGTQSCTDCPDWNNPDTYIDEGRGKWRRKIRRVERKFRRAQRKLNRLENRLYNKYIETLDDSQDKGGFFDKLTAGVKTPNDKFAFDMRDKTGIKFRIKDAWMYLFNSGVRDFYVESEINLDLRDWGEKPEERHYDHLEYTNTRELFSTDHIKVGNFYKYDYSLSVGKLFNNFVSWGSVQDRSYDPLIAETCFTYRPKRLLYSLPQFEEDKKDNWRVFLPLNYKDFNSIATAMKPIGKNGAIILFENESPVQFMGVDQLQTDAGTKITIGDGGLFNQPLQNLVNAEYPYEYGSCQNRLSVANTPTGLYYISQNQGKIFQVTGNGLREISNQGMKWWFAKHLPYRLTDHPTAFIDPVTGEQRPFELLDNPVNGIGCQTIFDNNNGIVFFCKKDWEIRTDIPDTITYTGEGTTFLVNGILSVELGDPDYFRPASWTVSWDPKVNQGNGAWIGYHDWHPDLVIPSKNTFMTTKDGGIWVHADTCESYCNFYGVDYPFEVEFTLHTQAQVNTLRNIMYFMEVYTYADNCYDRFHVLDFNFDEAIVYNSEQCSGLLKLNLTPKNNAPEIVNFPVINPTSIDILYAKEEHKYRFNQFWDVTDDRGEFSPAERTIFLTQPNGYIRDLNPANLNYNKFELERKKFRHYKNTVLLRRKVSGNKNMIIAMAIQMNLNSSR